MKGIRRITTWILAALAVLIVVTFVVAAAQVADAPSPETPEVADIAYRIENDGRLVDAEGRTRGWLKGDEIFGPNLELKYRVAGKQIEEIY
jgi:hypothetical protein